MDEVIDDIISMQSNYDIQGFIDAVQMPNTVSESNAAVSLFSLTDPSSEFTPFSRSLATVRPQVSLFYSVKISEFHCFHLSVQLLLKLLLKLLVAVLQQ